MLLCKNRNTKRNLAFALLLVVCCGILLWFGATRNRNVIRLNDPRTAQAEVLRHIPIGSDVRQAEKMLEQSGFDCWLADGEKYRFGLKKQNIFQRVEKFAKNPELRAVRDINTGFGFRVSYWNVTIKYKNLRVTSTDVYSMPVGYNL